MIVANSYHIKWIPGKKTDTIDSEWIAELALNDLISPSRILSKEQRDIRALTRLREKLVNERTDHKNRVHKILDSACIRLSAYFYGFIRKIGFEDSQMYLIGCSTGRNCQEITQTITHKIRCDPGCYPDSVISTAVDPIQTSVTMIDILNDQDQGIGTDNSQRHCKKTGENYRYSCRFLESES